MFSTLLKLTIAATCIIVLTRNISINNLTGAFSRVAQTDTWLFALLLSTLTTLLLLNILLEVAKWKFLVAQFGVTTFAALKQVLAGIAGGLISPNRIGDPITRCYLLPPKFRIRGLLPATFCSFSQLLATAIFGSIALMRISNHSLPSIPSLAITQFILVLLLGSLIWIAMRFFENRVGRIRFSKALIVVGLSLIRYFVFCLELWVIFLLFSPSVKFEPMFFAVSLTFLANAVIPSFSFTELGVRSAGAAVFFPLFEIDATVAVTATVILWFINVALPAIPGIMMLTSDGISLNSLKELKRQLLKKEKENSDVLI